MDQAVLLLSQYCDNDLCAEDEATFVAWLKRDPANVDRFARATLLHSQIYDAIQEEGLQSNAWALTLKDDDSCQPASVAARLPSRSLEKRFWMLAIACLLLGVLATSALWSLFGGEASVAQVTRLEGTVTTAEGRTVSVGALVPIGETFHIADGNVLITFECGAKVLVEGPSSFVVNGSAAGSLQSGTASANVPTQAIGFVMHTSLVDVVDLGTEFQLRILNDSQVDLHVFDGLVEVRLAKVFGHAQDGPLQISEGRSARFDLQKNSVTSLNYDESLKRVF